MREMRLALLQLVHMIIGKEATRRASELNSLTRSLVRSLDCRRLSNERRAEAHAGRRAHGDAMADRQLQVVLEHIRDVRKVQRLVPRRAWRRRRRRI